MNDIKDLKGFINVAPSGEFPVWEEPGKKFDSEKPKMYLLPPKATVEVAKVLTFGAAKYDEENWRKLEDAQNRYSGGALRHIFSHLDGELEDPETNLSHLAHAICCLLFKLELELENDKKNKEEGLRESNSEQHRESDYVIEPHRHPYRETDN
tara:strand:+ start:152 stop:610 length:459 start_codon:yes stop_codon:yes gene_type:complete